MVAEGWTSGLKFHSSGLPRHVAKLHPLPNHLLIRIILGPPVAQTNEHTRSWVTQDGTGSAIRWASHSNIERSWLTRGGNLQISIADLMEYTISLVSFPPKGTSGIKWAGIKTRCQGYASTFPLFSSPLTSTFQQSTALCPQSNHRPQSQGWALLDQSVHPLGHARSGSRGGSMPLCKSLVL